MQSHVYFKMLLFVFSLIHKYLRRLNGVHMPYTLMQALLKVQRAQFPALLVGQRWVGHRRPMPLSEP